MRRVDQWSRVRPRPEWRPRVHTALPGRQQQQENQRQKTPHRLTQWIYGCSSSPWALGLLQRYVGGWHRDKLVSNECKVLFKLCMYVCVVRGRRWSTCVCASDASPPPSPHSDLLVMKAGTHSAHSSINRQIKAKCPQTSLQSSPFFDASIETFQHSPLLICTPLCYLPILTGPNC